MINPLQSPLPARHGFFTRAGGVSQGPYASLNASTSGADDPVHVAENRARIAQYLGAATLLGVTQVHGAAVVTVNEPWAFGAGGKADAMVTNRPGVALGIVTADCAPVLLQGDGVIGAVHAGWRGAVLGVLEATIAAMRALGARAGAGDIVAAIGPCIRQPSYEVGADLRDAVLAQNGAHAGLFAPGRAGHWQFDLAGYCAARLEGLATVHIVDADTYAEPDRFWSHRRRTLENQAGAGCGVIGHQLSAIVLQP